MNKYEFTVEREFSNAWALKKFIKSDEDIYECPVSLHSTKKEAQEVGKMWKEEEQAIEESIKNQIKKFEG